MTRYEVLERKYLASLAKEYTNVGKCAAEIINLEAILNLPKGTEHFLSDIHGEHEAFDQVLRNGSGVVKGKITDMFGKVLDQKEINNLSTLIYYPDERMELLIRERNIDMEAWYHTTLYRLIALAKYAATKYTRSKVRKLMPEDFAYIMDELMNESDTSEDKTAYFEQIVRTIIELDRAREVISAFCYLIQDLCVDHLHIVGDIYDRGEYPDRIIDTLMGHRSVDIQWGNHDIVWMGAAAGSLACLANVIRLCARYGNLDVLEDNYGISLRPLALFADEVYGDDPCTKFIPKAVIPSDRERDIMKQEQDARMHKAISMIQFKLESQVIKRRPEFRMNHRLVLDFINYEDKTITLDGIVYPLSDPDLQTINPEDPCALTEAEAELMDVLMGYVRNAERFQSHIRYLYAKGSLYLKFNNNLLFHGCIPLNEDGSFMSMSLHGQSFSGRALMDEFDKIAREAYFVTRDAEKKQYGLDVLWYLWEGEASSLFGKHAMTTFERYFVMDKITHKEKGNLYYKKRDDEETCIRILKEFDMDETAHIINGHTPVKAGEGENPVKADGRLIVIDGGFSRVYHKTTGHAGYTLLFNSYGLLLVRHQPFLSKEDAIRNEKDIVSTRRIVEREADRIRVRETDSGQQIQAKVDDLKLLLEAYRSGAIKEDLGVRFKG